MIYNSPIKNRTHPYITAKIPEFPPESTLQTVNDATLIINNKYLQNIEYSPS